MKKIKYILFIIIISFIISGCITENEVVGPVPATAPEGYSTLNMDNKTTLNGSYQIIEFEAINPSNTLDIMTLQGILNMQYNVVDDQINVTYALEYAGYNAGNNLNKQTEAQTTIDINNITILDENPAYYMTFNDPLELTIKEETYNINMVKKLIDNPLDIESFSLDNLSSIIYLCDPTINDENNENACANVNGALKYIGYYRIEKMICDNETYTGSAGDLAGEMTAHASVGSIVEVPISIKFQVDNDTLASCVFGNNKPANNLYHDNTTYEVHSIANGLSSVFADLGLIGITDEDADEITRITTLNYEPRTQTVTEDEILYGEKDFGSGNPVSLKLKIQHQWSMGNTETVRNVLDDTLYIKITTEEVE